MSEGKDIQRDKKWAELKLSRHPKMELYLGVPHNHVIIDKDVFEELLKIHGESISKG